MSKRRLPVQASAPAPGAAWTALLSQERFPRLWLAFQKLVGGTKDKRRLATLHYKGQRTVLEIGCSVGIVSEAFTRFAGIQFTGIDIDESALDHARKRLASFPNFRFRNIGLSELARTGETFDYVLFANILHHVDDETAVALLTDVQSLLTPNSTLVVMEPEKIRDDYGHVFKLFYKFEKGEFRRPKEALIELVKAAGMDVEACTEFLLAPDSMPFLKVGRTILIEVAASTPRVEIDDTTQN